MRCDECGEQNRAQNAYCESCGANLGDKCLACGHINQSGGRFCGQCRAPLAGQTAATNQNILRSLQQKGGERRYLTVLFADIRNSTMIIDSLGDPELAMRRLDPVLELMKDSVHKFGGIVNKVQGDGIMALFGAPRAYEDHAVRGCLAALAMQDAAAKLPDSSLGIRVGLHTGEVVVQTVENSIYQTYDAAGVHVHLASRMEQSAEEGTILISETTYAAARQFIEAICLGPFSLKGIAAPVEGYRLLGTRHAPSSEIFRVGQLSPFIGRETEMVSLEAELGNAARGEGRVVGIVGEAGVGKSRLCFEFAENCRRRGIRVYEARVLAHGRATPLQPVLELLRDIFGIRTSESLDILRARVIDRIAALSSPEILAPLVLEFLGMAAPNAPAPKPHPLPGRAEHGPWRPRLPLHSAASWPAPCPSTR